MAPYSGEEVDGIPAVFYKRFWGLIVDRVKGEALVVLNGGEMTPGWNDTIIVLIPKVINQKNSKCFD
jgi:hypothetical protein